MINENLALVPMQGLRDQGQVISQSGNQLFNALMQNKNMEHQQKVFDFRKEQHAGNIAHRDRMFESSQNQIDLQNKEAARQKALQNMDFLGNAADKLLMTPPGQRQALAQTMMTELSQHMDPKTVARLASGPLDDGSLRRFKDTMDVARKKVEMTPFQERNLDIQERRLDLQEQTAQTQKDRLDLQAQKHSTTNDVDHQKDLAEGKAFGRETGKTKAQDTLSLPQTIATAEHTLSTLDKVLAHPGRLGATGASSKLNPANFTPGTDEYDFNVLMDQVQGKTFLQAYESLKGGGQITEVEGKKAEQAIARLNTAQSEEAFASAIEELREVVVSGLERAKAKAQPSNTSFTNISDDDLLSF